MSYDFPLSFACTKNPSRRGWKILASRRRAFTACSLLHIPHMQLRSGGRTVTPYIVPLIRFPRTVFGCRMWSPHSARSGPTPKLLLPGPPTRSNCCPQLVAICSLLVVHFSLKSSSAKSRLLTSVHVRIQLPNLQRTSVYFRGLQWKSEITKVEIRKSLGNPWAALASTSRKGGGPWRR